MTTVADLEVHFPDAVPVTFASWVNYVQNHTFEAVKVKFLLYIDKSGNCHEIAGPPEWGSPRIHTTERSALVLFCGVFPAMDYNLMDNLSCVVLCKDIDFIMPTATPQRRYTQLYNLNEDIHFDSIITTTTNNNNNTTSNNNNHNTNSNNNNTNNNNNTYNISIDPWNGQYEVIPLLWHHFVSAQQYYYNNRPAMTQSAKDRILQYYQLIPKANGISSYRKKLECVVGVICHVAPPTATSSGLLGVDVYDVKKTSSKHALYLTEDRFDKEWITIDRSRSSLPPVGSVCVIIASAGNYILFYPIFHPYELTQPWAAAATVATNGSTTTQSTTIQPTTTTNVFITTQSTTAATPTTQSIQSTTSTSSSSSSVPSSQRNIGFAVGMLGAARDQHGYNRAHGPGPKPRLSAESIWLLEFVLLLHREQVSKYTQYSENTMDMKLYDKTSTEFQTKWKNFYSQKLEQKKAEEHQELLQQMDAEKKQLEMQRKQRESEYLLRLKPLLPLAESYVQDFITIPKVMILKHFELLQKQQQQQQQHNLYTQLLPQHFIDQVINTLHLYEQQLLTFLEDSIAGANTNYNDISCVGHQDFAQQWADQQKTQKEQQAQRFQDYQSLFLSYQHYCRKILTLLASVTTATPVLPAPLLGTDTHTHPLSIESTTGTAMMMMMMDDENTKKRRLIDLVVGDDDDDDKHAHAKELSTTHIKRQRVDDNNEHTKAIEEFDDHHNTSIYQQYLNDGLLMSVNITNHITPTDISSLPLQVYTHDVLQRVQTYSEGILNTYQQQHKLHHLQLHAGYAPQNMLCNNILAQIFPQSDAYKDCNTPQLHHQSQINTTFSLLLNTCHSDVLFIEQQQQHQHLPHATTGPMLSSTDSTRDAMLSHQIQIQHCYYQQQLAQKEKQLKAKDKQVEQLHQFYQQQLQEKIQL